MMGSILLSDAVSVAASVADSLSDKIVWARPFIVGGTMEREELLLVRVSFSDSSASSAPGESKLPPTSRRMLASRISGDSVPAVDCWDWSLCTSSTSSPRFGVPSLQYFDNSLLDDMVYNLKRYNTILYRCYCHVHETKECVS